MGMESLAEACPLVRERGVEVKHRLDRIKDWKGLAAECGFQLKRMAGKSGVSQRTLRRYFQKQFGISPKEWRDAMRLEIAFLNLVRGEPVKVVSSNLKFKHAENFSAFIKRQTGRSPIDYRRRTLKCPF